ncbi:MAG: hypothetical protein AB3N63_17015 [Puniceicoccaceae bacterium]
MIFGAKEFIWLLSGLSDSFVPVQESNYTLSFDGDIGRIRYFGQIHNEDIKKAHSELRDHVSFFQCKGLIIDLLDCNLEKVNVPGLLSVNVTDLGASLSVMSLRVAFVANSDLNMKRTSDFIIKSMKLMSPWEWRQFQSEENALEWFEEA